MPVTERSPIDSFKRGNDVSRERLTSENFTVAFTRLLISAFTRAVMASLKNRGRAKAAATNSTTSTAKAMSSFFFMSGTPESSEIRGLSDQLLQFLCRNEPCVGVLPLLAEDVELYFCASGIALSGKQASQRQAREWEGEPRVDGEGRGGVRDALVAGDRFVNPAGAFLNLSQVEERVRLARVVGDERLDRRDGFVLLAVGHHHVGACDDETRWRCGTGRHVVVAFESRQLTAEDAEITCDGQSHGGLSHEPARGAGRRNGLLHRIELRSAEEDPHVDQME